MVTVIIPSLNPDEKLMQVIRGLISVGVEDIIVVDDGSDAGHKHVFDEAKALCGCVVLRHEVNCGKGRALKTAFEYCIKNRPGISGVVTVDGDNQHTCEDIRACADLMEKEHRVILGVRSFDGKDVPAKSRLGNKLTSFVFRFACGMVISDTQTGLRAIPSEYLHLMCEVEGERFEYETNMLLSLKKYSIPYSEHGIKTVYIDENATTHFHPIRDSFKIYAIIFKYLFGSLSASLIDIVLFSVFKIMTVSFGNKLSIFTSTAAARIFSSFYNYNFNRKAVFKSDGNISTTLFKYYSLCVIQMLLSYILVYLINNSMGLGNLMTIISKILVDTFLFVISFQIQRVWVFR